MTSSWLITGLRELVRRHSWVAVEAILLDRFAPPALWQRQELRQRIRMFVLSHLVGPPLGLAMVGYLFALHPVVDTALLIFVAAVIGFWAYPWALRRTGRFTLLAFVSLQQLTVVILFVSYHYGGMSSPFFFWLLVVPLFGLFYLGDLPRMRWAVVGALVAEVVLFIVALRVFGPAAERIPAAAVDGMILVSVICASVYVTLMALSHARVLASQSELQREVADHRRTAEQLRSASAAAEAASRAKTEFLATMSHELRTPLNAIIGYGSLLGDEIPGPVNDGQRRQLERIGSSARHLLALIDEVLTLSRIELGEEGVVAAPVQVASIVEDAAAMVEPQARAKGLDFVVSLPDTALVVETDAAKLRQALVNLLGNAVKFTESGAVRLRVVAPERDGDLLAFEIEDTGVGIAPEHLERVFDSFWQVNQAHSRKVGGVGLGLHITRQLVRLLGGDVSVSSTLGQGSRFTLRLPRIWWARSTGTFMQITDARGLTPPPSPSPSPTATRAVTR